MKEKLTLSDLWRFFDVMKTEQAGDIPDETYEQALERVGKTQAQKIADEAERASVGCE